MNRIVLLLFSIFLSGSITVSGETLYATNFDSFPIGDNSWAGFDGWQSNDTTSGAQAIEDSLFLGALGNIAGIGFNRPNNAFTTVFRSINYDPEVGGNPLLEIQTLFGIEDSTEFTNFRRDDFFFSFYNMDGNLLASIRISNQDTEFGFWRRDGNLQAGGTETDTGQDFIHGELHNLNARIDLSTNRWTVSLDGIPLFQDATFNGTGLPRTLGPVAAEWQIGLGSPFGYGDNWMLVADLSIETVEVDPPPLRIDSIKRHPPDSITLSWEAGPGYKYTVEYSDDLQNWFADLPDATKTSPLIQKTFDYTDATSPKPLQRQYRVRRTPVGGGAPSTVQHQSRDSEGEITLAWSARAGFAYQVEFSDDHRTWSATLPDSTFPVAATDSSLTFTDSGAPGVPTRLYRLIRTAS